MDKNRAFDVEKEKIDYESLGKWLKRVREKHNLTQDYVASEYFKVSRTVLSKYEKGTVRPPVWEYVEHFASAYHENLDELNKKVSVVIPDTCALLKNKRLLHMLLEDYDQVLIPSTVANELSYRKNHGKDGRERRLAWQIMANIDYYVTEYSDRIRRADSSSYKVPQSGDTNIDNDQRIIALARDIAKKTIGDVIIITDDIDITTFYDQAVRIDDYMAKRSNTTDYEDILDLDHEYRNICYYEEMADRLDLDAYLPDSMTLLISCIRCRTRKKSEQLGRQPTEKEKYDKLRFLIKHGVDINKNDNGQYCLPPLAHCVQIGDWEAFTMLLDAGCDFNKASRDERTASYMKVGKLNEGNTPLMIACWDCRKQFVERLCGLNGISLNQQDSNGYTALIKCTVKRYKRKMSGAGCRQNEELYHYLLKRGADPLIRDRNNHTAEDWWKRGNDPDYKADEQW